MTVWIFLGGDFNRMVRSLLVSINDIDRWRPYSLEKAPLTAIPSTLIAIFQSAGGFMLDIGNFISFLATLPIFFSYVLFYSSSNLPPHILTNFLLFIIRPSELIIFPFTTGSLGIAIGVAFFN